VLTLVIKVGCESWQIESHWSYLVRQQRSTCFTLYSHREYGSKNLQTARGHFTPPQEHVCNGLARPCGRVYVVMGKTTGKQDSQRNMLKHSTSATVLYIARGRTKVDFRPFVDPTCARVEDRDGSISPLPISIQYRYFWLKISAISMPFTAALFGLLIYFIIASKVVNDVNVIP